MDQTFYLNDEKQYNSVPDISIENKKKTKVEQTLHDLEFVYRSRPCKSYAREVMASS